MALPPEDGAEEPEFERFRNSFLRQGTKAQEDTLDLLREVIGRTKALRRPRAIKCSVDQDFCRESAPFDVALLSIPICIEGVGGEIFPCPPSRDSQVYWLKQKRFDHFQLCVRDTSRTIEAVGEWCDHLKEACARLLQPAPAGQNGVKFLLVNELGYPNFWLGNLMGLEQARLRHSLHQLSFDLHSRLQQLASERNAVIIAGSAHDVGTFQNWGPIFFPEAKRSVDHTKLTSAYKIGEHTKTGTDTDYPVYGLGTLTFSVLVCSDAFDLNIFFEPFANAPATSRLIPTIVFVPAYYSHVLPDGRRHALREACRQLSRVTNVIVVFCNQGFDPSCQGVFVGGAELKLRHDGPMEARVTIDGAELSSLRDRAMPVWTAMSELFRNPASIWPTR